MRDNFRTIGELADDVVKKARNSMLEVALLAELWANRKSVDGVVKIIDAGDFGVQLNAHVFDALLGARIEGSEFGERELRTLVFGHAADENDEVRRYVDAIVRPVLRSESPRAAAIRVRAHAKARREASAA